MPALPSIFFKNSSNASQLLSQTLSQTGAQSSAAGASRSKGSAIERSLTPPIIMPDRFGIKSNQQVEVEPENILTDQTDKTIKKCINISNNAYAEGNALQAGKYHLLAEAHLLKALLNMGETPRFLTIQQYMQVQFNRPAHDLINCNDDLDKELKYEIKKIIETFEKNNTGETPAEDLPAAELFKSILNNHISRVGNHVSAYDSLVKEVVENEKNQADKTLIEQNHLLFCQHAAQLQKQITTLPDHIHEFLEFRIEKIKFDLKDEASGLTEQEIKDLVYTQDIFEDLKNVCTALNHDGGLKNLDFKQAINHLNATRFVHDMNATNNFSQKIIIFLKEAVPQGVSSLFAFGLARNMAADRLSSQSAALQILLTGIIVGAAHKAATDFPKAWLQAAMEAVIPYRIKPVNASEVMPHANRVVTRDGKMHKRSDAEISHLNADIDKIRERFGRDKNAHKFGTISGDFTGYSSFGTMAASLELARVFTDRREFSVGTRAAMSAAGGILMAGLHAFNQLGNTSGGIHTHRLETITTTLGQGTSEALRTSIKNYRLHEPAKARTFAVDLTSKMAGITEGLAFVAGLKAVERNVMGSLSGAMNPVALYQAEKASQVVLAFLSSFALLGPFFANNVAGAEAQKAGVGRESIGYKNMFDPSREELSHTTNPERWSSTAENWFHRLRGAQQVLPQIPPVIAAEVAERGAGALAGLGQLGAGLALQTYRFERSRNPHTTNPDDIEMQPMPPASPAGSE